MENVYALDSLENLYKKPPDLFQYLEKSNHYILIYFAIDRIKQIATFEPNGHEVAESIIRKIIAKIHDCFDKEKHSIYRMESSEFVIVLEEPISVKISTLQRVLKESIINVVAPIELNTAVGISTDEMHLKDPRAAFNRAYYNMLYDQLANRVSNSDLYQIKKCSFEAAIHCYEIERDLKNALAVEELHTVFQPIVHRDNYIGLETLIRWQSPIHGNVSPEEFIPVAEKSLLIEKITEIAIRDAVKMLRKHQQINYITVNLSPHSLTDITWLLAILNRVMNDSPFKRKELVFEITESGLLSEKHWASIEQLRKLGHFIFIDDFGTGQTNVAQLLQTSVDGVKIDRSFISEFMLESKKDFILATVALCKSQGLCIVIEGVELESQQQFVNTTNTDAVQGFLIAPPMRPEIVTSFLRKKAREERKK